MFTLALRAFSQVFEPHFRKILIRSLLATIVVLIAMWLAINAGVQVLLSNFSDLPGWVDWVVGAFTGVGVFIALGYLLAPVCAIVVAFYQDSIAEIVERDDYPAHPVGRPLPFDQALLSALRFAGIVLLANIVALLLLLVPGVNLVAFFLINGYLLGREFFEFAATRYLKVKDAKLLREFHSKQVFTAGLLIAVVLSIPILNLITPIFATIYMVHVYKRLHGKSL
ncbi:sulfate transporter family protein [Polycladidibacter hongkongensis]|uniref:sulfate transporter family protein n=1 Tax=Polycladidibacter hongkongensis TaxID=1647556 RepID=UPI000834EA01|nr:sulfate transporter family protein [Pseudovibrio hongkongensis]